jgi:hypothetical protein
MELPTWLKPITDNFKQEPVALKPRTDKAEPSLA